MSLFREVDCSISRRQLLKIMGAGAMSVGMAGCVAIQLAPGSAPSGEAAQEPASIEYWFIADTPREREMYDGFFSQFQEQHPEIELRTDQPPSIGELRTKLLTAWAAQAGLPDASILGSIYVPEFVEAGALLAMDEQFSDWEFSADVIPNMVTMARGRLDNLYYIPSGGTVSYLYYRSDWLEEAGLTPPDSWDELLTVAQEFTAPPDRYGFAFRGGDWAGLVQQVNHIWWGWGVDIIQDDGTVDIDSPAGIEAMDWYVSLYSQHKVTQPTALTDMFPEMFAQFQGGVVGMLMHALHSWREQDEVLKENLGVVMIPKGPVDRGARLSLGGSVILNSTEHPEATWDLVSFLSEPAQARIAGDVRGNLPAFMSLQEDSLYDNRFYRAAFDSGPYLREVPSWHPGWSVLADSYGPELQRLMREEVTPEEFCTSLAEAMRGA